MYKLRLLDKGVLTFTCNTISCIASHTHAIEATHVVCAVRESVTVVCVHCTLINICGRENGVHMQNLVCDKVPS